MKGCLMNDVKKAEKASKILIINVPKEIHSEIKAQAAWRNITMRQYVLQAILERMRQDKKYE